MRKTLVLISVVTMMMLSGCATSTNNDTMSTAAPTKNIAEIAMSTGMHNTLVAALKAAGLAEMMMQPGDYTVFAPTDAAFAKLPAGTVDNLLKPENRDQLRAVLQYHVVPGRVSAQQVMGMTSATSVSGRNLPISTMGGTVMVGSSHVVKSDVMATNGVIHVIDTVLLPPSM